MSWNISETSYKSTSFSSPCLFFCWFLKLWKWEWLIFYLQSFIFTLFFQGIQLCTVIPLCQPHLHSVLPRRKLLDDVLEDPQTLPSTCVAPTRISNLRRFLWIFTARKWKFRNCSTLKFQSSSLRKFQIYETQLRNFQDLTVQVRLERWAIGKWSLEWPQLSFCLVQGNESFGPGVTEDPMQI